jgi:threonine dehydratase
MVTLEAIQDARLHIADRIHRTPMFSVASIGRPLGVNFFVKAELLQKTGSFKVRGVLNRIRQLSTTERELGLIGISAGNHAAALAWAATAAGVECTVVMPAHAAQSKVEASRAYGANVILKGDVFAAFARMDELREQHGYTLVHPFDDEAIIAGHGTLGIEIIEDLPDVDVVLVPVGGGGLLSGVARAIKAMRPATRVIGVEPEGAANLRAGLDAGRVVRLERIDTIADGLAPPMTGEHVLEHVKEFVDDVVTVPDTAIVQAMKTIMTHAKLFVVPSGAAGLAALDAGRCRIPEGSRVVIVASGGNIDTKRLKEMI